MDAARLVPDRYVEYYLGNGPSLVWLIVVNATAFLVGVRFYVETMPGVSTFLWPLYGDSPTALALATLSLATLLPALGRTSPLASPTNRPLAYLHTLSFVWLVKYGLWTAVALNLRPALYVGFTPAALWNYWGIVLTHLLFVVEALLIARVGRTTKGALALALALLFANDVFDYAFGFHPPLRYEPGTALVAVTVALSVLSVWFAAAAFESLDGSR
ncbi:DUF1405 domain-containing protein [Halegenticoccus tardaugens]|uniref:DUF1405 domain-containing protein n=1 Tax=Halegenticoccus tardaugens TaxID=2071624 RepID=UPI00100B39C4|nr:DUF1405 domain-containing protein [Halegenticoccus tardaugens]